MWTLEFLVINLVLAVGISIDAVMATLAGFAHFASRRASLRWSVAVGGAHWLFPLVGFVGGYYIADGRISRILVYALGGLVLAVFTGMVLRDATRTQAGASSLQKRFPIAVIAVSLDALVTGPGKTAVTAHWSAAQVWLSFFVVGLLVFVFVLAATIPARYLHDRSLRAGKASQGDIRRGARAFSSGIFLEVTVFSYFVLRSAKEVLQLFEVELSQLTMAIVTTTLASVLLLTCWPLVYRAQLDTLSKKSHPDKHGKEQLVDGD